MFDTKTNINERLADAVDLLIDFATLGEYGLEPAASPATVRTRPRPGRGAERPATFSLVRSPTSISAISLR